MPVTRRRTLISSAVALGLAGASVAWSAATASPGAATATATRGVIVLLRNQHTDLTISRGTQSPRVAAARSDQAPVLARARQWGAKDVRGYGVVNAFAATVTTAQLAELAADPSVAAIVPDRVIAKPAPIRETGVANVPARTDTTRICPTDPTKPLLEPEALQTTHTAFMDPSVPQAQNLVTGAGVRVGWIADSIDVDNPDFIRPDGTHVISEYVDFSGDGLNTPTDARESFGDASSIAAQGRHPYDLANWVNASHALPAGCTITVRGVAPGTTLVGLKVFGNSNFTTTSKLLTAVDYAVNVAGVDVLNESFGVNLFPDTTLDPIALADDAAAAAGIVVVSGTGDAGTTGTIGTPSSDPNIISVAGSTNYRAYQQQGLAGANLDNGQWVNDNITPLSSGGFTGNGRVPDLTAPGDSGWALCTPDLTRYLGCSDNDGEPSPIQDFGGTSQSSPLVAGAAALVIQAYKQTHHGVRPAPALVKRFLTSTATDLGYPGYEQGAGEVNTLAAVQAAMSWHDTNGSPARTGDGLIVNPNQFTAVGVPGATVRKSFTVTNTGASAQTVTLSTRKLGAVLSRDAGTMHLDVNTAPTFIDAFGAPRSFVEHDFTVPRGATRVDMSIAAPTPVSPIRVVLIDPRGRFVAFSVPQGPGNFGHVDAAYPVPGVWKSYSYLNKSSGFVGDVRFEVTTQGFTTAGSVSPHTVTIPAGATRAIDVTAKLPGQVGDVAAAVQITRSHGAAVSVPFVQRVEIPTSHRANPFTGVITGGNGRQVGGTGGSQTFAMWIPPGKKDFTVDFTLDSDPGVVVVGILKSPDNTVVSYESNLDTDGAGNAFQSAGFQVHARDPKSGAWTFTLQIFDPVPGTEVSQGFHASLVFDSIRVSANLPSGASTRLAAGVPVVVPVKITNTGPVPQTYFTDARLDRSGDMALADVSGVPQPVTLPDGPTPNYILPPEMTKLVITADSTVPVTSVVQYSSGNPELAADGHMPAVIETTSPNLSAGFWFTDITEQGPFDPSAPAGTATVSAVATGKLFDPAVTSTTGDLWPAFVASSFDATTANRVWSAHRALVSANAPGGHHAPAAPATAPVATGPVTVAPGDTVTVYVTITPSASVGTVVHGHLYVDTFGAFTGGGDELIDLPYTYRVK